MYCRPVSRQLPCSSRACWKGVENNFEILLRFLNIQSESDLGAVNLSSLIWFARSTHSLHLERTSSALSKMPQDKWHFVQTKELRNVSSMVDKDHSKSVSLIFILETILISHSIWRVKGDYQQGPSWLTLFLLL